MNESAEIKYVQEQIDQLRIKTPTMEMQVSNLSGGNQQKVVIAKWLLAKPDILVVDETDEGALTWGAIYEIYKILNARRPGDCSGHDFIRTGRNFRDERPDTGCKPWEDQGELDIQDASQETIMNCAWQWIKGGDKHE